MSNLVPFQDKASMADAIVKSGFYGFKTREQVLALMFVAEAEGKHIATVVQEYDVIQGRPALKTQAILSRFQQSGGKVQWGEMTPKKCVGTFSHESGGTLTVEWTIEMARQAGLARPGSGWEKYPEDMLRARCIARGVRSVYPACMLGQYSVEEVSEFDPPRKGKEIDMGNITPITRVAEPTAIDPVYGEEPVADYKEDFTTQTLADIKDDTEGIAYQLMLPDGTVFSHHDTAAEWCVAYVNMVNRIMGSEKFKPDVKQEKINAFRKVNEATKMTLPMTDRIAISQMIDTGGTGAVVHDLRRSNEFVATPDAV